MKRILVRLLTVIFVLSTSVTTAFGYSAADVVVTPGQSTATVNGEEATLDVPAKIINGRTMVPIRFVAENLGFDVGWNRTDKTIAIGENGKVSLKVGSTTATVDGKTVALDSAPVIENGRTLVPLRFILESLGAEVNWDSEAKCASIEYSDQMIQARELYGNPAAGEDKVLKALDDKFAYKVATDLAAYGDAKDGRGMHLAGSKAGKAAAQYAFDTFKEIGLKPQFNTFDATGWEYYGSSLSIKGHDDLDYFITSAPNTPPTSAGGITGQLVYVGTATKDDLAGIDLTGKIALVDFDWDYTLWMNNFEHEAANHGAIGVIYYTTNPYGIDESGQAEFVCDWSGIKSTIPVWSMRNADGQALAELAQKEDLTVTAVSDCKIIDNATGYNVLATIKGAKYPDEYIVITAHTDAYFHDLQDASAPVGIVMAMAKAMVDTNYKPDRSIIFVTTDGEEAGGGETFYDWLAGSWALVNDKVSEWGGRIVDNHTVEMIGDNKSTNFGFSADDIMYLFTKAMAYGMNQTGDYKDEAQVENTMTTGSDQWAFSYMGYPTTRTPEEERSGEVYHSTMDSTVRFSYDLFVEHMKAQTSIALRIDKQAFAPYDLARDAELYQDSLDLDALKAEGLDTTAMNAALTQYVGDAQRLLDLNLQISKLYRDAAAAGKDVSKVDALTAAYNQALRNTAKTVIQGTQYVALDIPVNQVEYYQRIPEVFVTAIDELKAGNGKGLLDTFYGLDSEDLGQYSVYYSEYLEYDSWVNQYREALDPGNPAYDVKWVTDIQMKYYDVYKIMESVNSKIKAGNKDFTAEIGELTKMKADAESRLADGFKEDLQAWKKADSQLPTAQAEKILAELQNIQ